MGGSSSLEGILPQGPRSIATNVTGIISMNHEQGDSGATWAARSDRQRVELWDRDVHSYPYRRSHGGRSHSGSTILVVSSGSERVLLLGAWSIVRWSSWILSGDRSETSIRLWLGTKEAIGQRDRGRSTRAAEPTFQGFIRSLPRWPGGRLWTWSYLDLPHSPSASIFRRTSIGHVSDRGDDAPTIRRRHAGRRPGFRSTTRPFA